MCVSRPFIANCPCVCFDQMRKVRGEVSWSEKNVIGKWREGSCDYASAAAVKCVTMHACHFYSIAAASGACANAELSCLA